MKATLKNIETIIWNWDVIDIKDITETDEFVQIECDITVLGGIYPKRFWFYK